MRVLLLGASGMLGSDLAAAAPSGASLDAPSSAELDVADAAAITRALDALRPHWVINAAAYTQVDRAESDVEAAERVNALAPGLIGEECARRGVRVLHFSTDYVFSGDDATPRAEGDPVDPVNAYGRTKLAGERALLGSGAQALIVRTSWLFGYRGKSFPRTMWERAIAGRPTRVVDDQFGRPTYSADLAAAAWALVAAGAEGVVHAANGGPVTTWFGVAERVFERAGTRPLLQPCATADYPTTARRPKYSGLDTDRLEHLVGPMPPWADGIDRFLDVLEATE